MVPTNVLQKAGGPGRTVRVNVVDWEPLRPRAPDTIQSPVRLTQPFPRAAAGVVELRARPLWRRTKDHQPRSPQPWEPAACPSRTLSSPE